jgi:cholesterol oxidase
MENGGIALSFSETMSGGFALGVVDPDEGKLAATRMALHAEITVRDVNRFIADPDHVGEMVARLDFEPLGLGIPARRAVFNLFSPSERPDLKLMVYELAFVALGKDYYLAGRKEIRNDPGVDLWTDTTTLRVLLHEGRDSAGPVVGAGVLSLGVPELMRMTGSMRVRNARSAAEAAAAVGAFGRFFLGALWDSYAPARIKRPTIWKWPWTWPRRG